MRIQVRTSYLSDLSPSDRAEAVRDFEALGAEIIDDGEHMARMEAAQQAIRQGVFGGFMERVRGRAA